MSENIQTSEIFLNHPDAAKAVWRYRFFRRLSLVLVTVVVATLIFLVATLSGFWEAEELVVHIFGILLLLAVSIASMTLLYMDGAEAGINKIRNKMDELTGLMSVIGPFDPEKKSAQEARILAREALIKRAERVVLFERQRSTLRMGGVSTDMSNLIFKFLKEETAHRRAMVGKLYDVLLEFRLVERGGYAWAFEEARKRLGLT